MKNIDTILMIGKTGSGKETQAKLLQEKIHFQVYSSGDRFREIKNGDTQLGGRIREGLDAGYLMPTWLAIYVFQEKLFSLRTGEGIILEGTGRKLPEAELFDEIAEWLDRVYVCFHLVVPDKEVIARQLKRGREDSDTEKKINLRLQEYYKYTVDVINFFKKRNKIIGIDGTGTPQEVHERIIEALRREGMSGI